MDGELIQIGEKTPPIKSKKSLEQPKNHLSKSKYDLKKRARKFTQCLLAGDSEAQALRNVGYSKATSVTGEVAILKNPMYMQPFISILTEEGVTDKFLAEKTKSLLDAKKTEYFQKDGIVTDQREVEALETQRKTLELATKLKGHLKEQSQGDINIGLMAVVLQAVKGGDRE